MKLITQIKSKINEFPRINLAYLPAPLEKLDRLSMELGASNIFIKRDDQTGLAFGGNKIRKLEFILADAIHKGANLIITWGGIQSNWCQQVAATANKCGLKTVLILFKETNSPRSYDGNYLLDFILGAKIKLITIKKSHKIMELKYIKEIVDEIIEKEIKNGEIPYIIPIGGSLVEGSLNKPLGAIGYVNACYEIFTQTNFKKINFNSIVVASSSGATQAGLIVGAKIFFPKTKIIGISCGDNKTTMHNSVKNLAKKPSKHSI